MTKYVGKHRTPPKWTTRKTIASTLAVAGIYTIASGSVTATPKTVSVTVPVTEVTVKKPMYKDPPDLPGNGDDELNEWLAQGAPGYIPDNRDSKGLVSPDSPVPKVTVVQATCDKPDLPGLSDHALVAYRTICALFPEITVFGGFRAGDQDHGTGNAIDNMVYGDTATGDELADWLITHADELHVKYIIWKQHIWQNLDGLRYWKFMDDRGSATANHYDHVHLSVN